MKSFFNNLSSRFPFFANRPSALERAVRQSPKSRRLRMEPLENRALLAVDAFCGAASLADSDVGESWGPDPAPAAFSASELSTDAAETTISLAALNDVPYGPYVTSEQAALIALRSNATLADETLADFGALWDETDETTLAETETDGETLGVVAEALVFESFDLGEIEQEPLPGDASLMSGSNGQGDGSGDQGNTVSVGFSGGNTYSGEVAGNVPQGVLVVTESMGRLQFTAQGSNCTQVTANFDNDDFSIAHYWSNDASAFFDIVVNADNSYEGDEITMITFMCGDQQIENYTVKIIDAPEFISDVDLEPGVTTDLVVNNDTAFAGFSTFGFTDESPVNVCVYTPSAYKAHDVIYSLGETYSDTYSYFTLEEDNSVWYDNLQAGGLRYGTVDVPLQVRYSQDLQFKDSMTLTVTWADVNAANTYLRNKCNEYLANNSWEGYDCLNATENLLFALDAFAASDLNAQHAVTTLNRIELDAHQDCPCAGPHYAVLVTYCDNTTQIFDLIPDDE